MVQDKSFFFLTTPDDSSRFGFQITPKKSLTHKTRSNTATHCQSIPTQITQIKKKILTTQARK